MAKMKGVVWGWCVLMALVSLVLPTSGQSCSENLASKVTSFPTANLLCNPYTVGSNQFYIWALKENSTTSMVVAVPLTPGNWAGMGFSSIGSMVKSTALIATFNSSGGAVATVYNLNGQTSATVVPGTGLSFVNGSSVGTSYDSTSGYVYMSYQVDLATSTPANASFLVMAYGPQSGTTLGQHSPGNRIVAPGNFVTGVVAGPSAASKLEKKIKVHGSLNILGWGLLLPIGAMVARYARCFDPAWFYTHILFQILGYGCIIAGIATGVDIAKLAQPDQLNAHRGLGIFLLVLASLQVLAVVLRPKKDAKVRKYWNWYHHWVGRLALFLAVINIFVGLHMSNAERDFKVGYISILSIELGAFVILEALLWLRWNRKRTSQGAPHEDPEFQFGENV